ncbi:hypothetical protein Kpol_473p9 [Vanderwaltozyma polyspora DSM 70294]|uniref:Phospholipid/glycerol acyltransferase domain-containing protein n=1 Tax=Vanderwaltozyma polyspora (strain ATCC 22028 / DSM 70294 / BCRC 21397 / CBS 2163 / NBRC 10782 / NRRL Y-8283 / UCD 57-17) TaxID=436907 RepID=A7TQ01_VANPO|nr:uncharacterized protein Kpol_473p9 [Vanderwaltozyma polyspora DSM 70294]EDO15650.1 hypothetical protein Kpol_473p9 [Vanderwaltozyma polyspora DSM 70294]
MSDEKPSNKGPSAHIPSADVKYSNPYNGLVYNFYTWLYDFVLFILNILFMIFFREVKVRGGHNIPPVGTPTIIVCAPHANQFIDPSLVMITARKVVYDNDKFDVNRSRQTCFVTAASGFKKPIVGQFGIATGGIPVPRQQDNLSKVDNRIVLYCPDMNKPTVIKGRVTDNSLENPGFTKRFTPKGLVGLPNFLANAKIESIPDDYTIILSSPFKNIDAPIQEKINYHIENGCTFKYAPKVDNSKVFQNVFNHLDTKGCVGIFPEGGSHDRPSLLPIKAGVAIMALGATAADPTLKVSIVPCGLNYFHRQKFRSRAVIEYGEPIIVDGEMGKHYKEDPRGAVSKLLKKVTDALYSVTENAPDYETLMTIQAARRLYKPASNNKKIPLPVVCQVNRNLLLGYSKFKDDPRIINLKTAVQNYNERLYSLGIKDHQVLMLKTGTAANIRTLVVLLNRIIKLGAFFTLALPGTILFTPVFVIAHYYSKKKQEEGLKKSVVKIKGIDLIATWKVMVALGFAPILYITYSLILVYTASTHRNWLSWLWIPFSNKVMQFFYFYGLLVLTTYGSLKTGEVGMDLLKSLAPLFVTLLYPEDTITDIQKLRNELSDEITDICNELGPEVIPNFESYRNSRKSDEDKSDSRSSSVTRSRSSSFSSLFSNALSRVNSRGSLTDIPIFADGRNFNETEDSSSSDEEIDDDNIFPSKITSIIRARRQNEKKEQ